MIKQRIYELFELGKGTNYFDVREILVHFSKESNYLQKDYVRILRMTGPEIEVFKKEKENGDALFSDKDGSWELADE